jgi:integrase
MTRADIRDGALWVTQNKTKAKLAIDIVGELASVVDRCLTRPRKATSIYLVQDDKGQPLTKGALRGRFAKAKKTAGMSDFQFRDIRAKAATDTGDLAHSQRLLSHKNRGMTEHYVRALTGERVKPLR